MGCSEGGGGREGDVRHFLQYPLTGREGGMLGSMPRGGEGGRPYRVVLRARGGGKDEIILLQKREKRRDKGPVSKEGSFVESWCEKKKRRRERT